MENEDIRHCRLLPNSGKVESETGSAGFRAGVFHFVLF